MELDRSTLRFFIFSFGVFLLNGCSPVKKLNGYSLNPVEYTFATNTEQLRKVIIENFDGLKYGKIELYYTGGQHHLLDYDILNKPENKSDFVIKPMTGKALGNSYVYKRRGKSLPYSAVFHLHLLKQDSMHTKIVVSTLDPYVIFGTHLLPTPPHFERDFKIKKVEPSTIEEYEILYRIGKSLNQDMPEVKYPN